jgi:hypothetical protein
MRHLLLLVAFALTVPLPLQASVLLVGNALGAGSPELEPFLVALAALAAINAAVAVTILWRRSGLLLLSGALLMTSVGAAWSLLVRIGLDSTAPLATALTWWAIVAILPAVFLLFPTVGVYFPDGMLPGRRWRPPYLAASAALFGGLLLQTISPVSPEASVDVFRSPFAVAAIPAAVGDIGAVLAIGAVLVAFAMALASVVVRYRRSAGVERAQVKWLVAAVVLNSVLFPLSYFFEFGPDALLDAVSVLAGCLIPVAIGIAVLRYHLYDIDRLISRTVSWSLVTAGVVAVFALLVVGLQAALAGFTQGETVAVALSTIVAAALFQPARRRVQQAIDRRFDRGRYDANLTAAAFAERLRNDLDLDAVTNELHTTVGLAVRPTTAGIWLIERGPR